MLSDLVFTKNKGIPIDNPKNGTAQIIKNNGFHFISCNLLFAANKLKVKNIKREKANEKISNSVFLYVLEII